MLSYEINGSILTLRASGTTTLDERKPVFDAIRADAAVPDNALILIDAREVFIGMSEPVVVERLRVLLDQLGGKLGRRCALVIDPGGADQAEIFKTEAPAFGLRVSLFTNEQLARDWLNQ